MASVVKRLKLEGLPDRSQDTIPDDPDEDTPLHLRAVSLGVSSTEIGVSSTGTGVSSTELGVSSTEVGVSLTEVGVSSSVAPSVADSYEDVAEIDFLCHLCRKGSKLPCFICGDSAQHAGEAKVKCHFPRCHKLYHETCLSSTTSHTKWSASKLESCPCHVCHMCASDNPTTSLLSSNDKYLRCVRCPSTYHATMSCIPAGTKILSAKHVLCPLHISKRNFVHFNTNWCFICTGANEAAKTLLNCRQCPVAVHPECCVEDANRFDEDRPYVCDDCKGGRFPLYGEVVWVRYGHFRWWPGQILFPEEIPDNLISKCEVGVFVVYFFGTHNYAHICKGQAYVFEEGDERHSQVKREKKRELDSTYMTSLREAAEAFREFQRNRDRIKTEETNERASRPSKYVKIKTNKPVGTVRLETDKSSTPVCECDESSPCGVGSSCINSRGLPFFLVAYIFVVNIFLGSQGNAVQRTIGSVGESVPASVDTVEETAVSDGTKGDQHMLGGKPKRTSVKDVERRFWAAWFEWKNMKPGDKKKYDPMSDSMSSSSISSLTSNSATTSSTNGTSTSSTQAGALFPLYGEVVWVRYGHFRWWPGQILFPEEISSTRQFVKQKQAGLLLTGDSRICYLCLKGVREGEILRCKGRCTQTYHAACVRIVVRQPNYFATPKKKKRKRASLPEEVLYRLPDGSQDTVPDDPDEDTPLHLRAVSLGVSSTETGVSSTEIGVSSTELGVSSTEIGVSLTEVGVSSSVTPSVADSYEDVAEIDFLCHLCRKGSKLPFPLYGEVVWVRYGHFRWWPGQILFPEEIPDNLISKCEVGVFVVYFFGTHNYAHICKGQAYVFEEGDERHSQVKREKKRELDSTYMTSLREAAEAFREFQRNRDRIKTEETNERASRPSKYVKIKTNKPVGTVRLETDKSSTPVCECDESSPCGVGSSCIN
ncbi:uncharacterized protein LOC103513873, partial [Diaphorina citri]|uniref:Uncharacterized protein LOC103513873 n=1 Tax=Diaphorina citri TaxID=121845 RepID=A0A3Q0J745_DIACI